MMIVRVSQIDQINLKVSILLWFRDNCSSLNEFICENDIEKTQSHNHQQMTDAKFNFHITPSGTYLLL